ASLNLGLDHRLADRMGLLYGGKRQAVSLLMASMSPMNILLLDEHTAALDQRTGALVVELTDRIVGERRLTTLLLAQSRRHALDRAVRTVMQHVGRVVLDVAGDNRKEMKVVDLLHMFAKVRGEEVADDALILGWP